ncbi:MAG: hypothetical protein ACRED8_02025 [Caulobacteraceae bacterium]
MNATRILPAVGVAGAALFLVVGGGVQAQPDEPRYNVPPPPGYSSADEAQAESDEARSEDDRYSYEAEQWAAHNCYRQRANNTAAGAVIGGLLGAVIGSGLSGRYHHAEGAFAGGAVGALAGGAIGSSSSPECPPGYVLRAGAPAFAPGPVYGGVIYTAPGWYDPWIWYGDHWIYRPYPYHRWWSEHHR